MVQAPLPSPSDGTNGFYTHPATNGHTNGFTNGHATEFEADVLIVGAGPVGLITALELHSRGVKVLCIDRQPSAYPLPRAVCLDHESYRLLWCNGMEPRCSDIFRSVDADYLDASGKRPKGFESFAWRNRDRKVLVAMDWDRPSASTFPQITGFSLEGRMQDEVLAQGIDLRRGLELISIEQDADGVTCEVIRAKKARNATAMNTATERICNGHKTMLRFKYVVGCDGTNSPVRELSRIPMTVLPFSYDWLVLDLLPKEPGVWPVETTEYGPMQLCDPDRPTTLASSGPGRKRLEFMRMPDETREQLMAPDNIWRLCGRWGFTPDNCIWERATVYTFMARWADTWNLGRVLLAGDAAHSTPPFIGQGMNSGFRDAGNLGWRLPLVLQGHASPALLDAYSSERIPHMVHVTKVAIRLGEVICLTDKSLVDAVHAEVSKNASEPHPEPGLGPGTFLAESTEAGQLAFMDQLRVDGRVGLADTVLSRGWTMYSTACDPLQRLSPHARHLWIDRLGGRSLHITRDSDVNGTYTRWMKLRGVQLVVMRPDFYIGATAASIDDADGVVLQLARLAHVVDA